MPAKGTRMSTSKLETAAQITRQWAGSNGFHDFNHAKSVGKTYADVLKWVAKYHPEKLPEIPTEQEMADFISLFS
jgi:hypothetical protein